MPHPFEIGNTYKNRKGLYEVVQLDEDQGKMVIRYLDSGEEAEVSISVQERIWLNMSWEEQEEVRQAEKEETRYQRGYGEDFTGLLESDFKTNTKGTIWRSRRGLAGRVAKALSHDTQFTFVSWAIYRWPVAFLTHREDYQMAAFEMGSRKAKFTIELDENLVYYGLYLERGPGNIDNMWDWPRFLSSLRRKPELQNLITRVETEHGIRFLGRSTSSTATFHFADGLSKGAQPLWDETNPAALSVAGRLQKLEQISDNQWGEIYLIIATPKEEAIQAGLGFANTMAGKMRHLLSLYAAAIRD